MRIDIIILILTLSFSISIIVFSLLLGISPMPISRKGKKILLQNLPELNNGTIFELGSGFGGLSYSLAKKYPRLSIHGYERSFFPWLISKIRYFNVSNLHFHKQDFFKVPLDDVSLIVCYLFPKAMQKLEKKLKTGPFFVGSYVFSLPSKRPEKIIEVNDLFSSKIYLYNFSDIA